MVQTTCGKNLLILEMNINMQTWLPKYHDPYLWCLMVLMLWELQRLGVSLVSNLKRFVLIVSRSRSHLSPVSALVHINALASQCLMWAKGRSYQTSNLLLQSVPVYPRSPGVCSRY